MPIRQLPAEVAAKIAAGEVVERPASVVKELVENAIDAGARHIRLDLRNGGLELIRVVDDGHGIAADELPLAFARHATSKLGAVSDLDRIATLGFRGEALASIAAVARVTLISRVRGAAAAAQIEADGSSTGALSPTGAPEGTSIAVRELFAEVPARLKFLKSRASETGHCLHLLEQMALAYPEIRFAATSEGRHVFATPGDGRLASVLVAVYGAAIAAEMLPFGAAERMREPSGDDDDAADAAHAVEDADIERAVAGARPRVHGAVSRPTCFKATRQYLSFFVNRRWVQSRTLSFAVEEAYHSLLLAGRHPIAVVNIELDPALVDVNVHPAKTEIRFLRERQVYAAVQRAVRAVVVATATTPEVSPRAFAIPTWGQPYDPATLQPASAAAPPYGQSGGNGQEPLWAGLARLGRSPDTEAGAAPQPSAGGAAPDGHTATGFAMPGVAAGAPVGGTKLPLLRVLGQVSQAYIVTEGPNGVYLVDQHAAHERILLERMVAEWRGRALSAQLLLEPLALELSASEREAIEEHLDALTALGFAIEPFGGDALLVRAVPGVLAAQARPQPLRELLVELAGGDSEAARHGETWEEHALANVACKAAIKAGQTLAPEEQRELIRQLEGTDARQSCCHGRPTMVHLSLDALEREFDRR